MRLTHRFLDLPAVPTLRATAMRVLAAVVLGLGAFSVVMLSGEVGRAQDAGKSAPAAKEAETEELTEVQPAKAPAAGEPSEEKEQQPKEQTMLEWMGRSLGVSYSVVFLAISFTLVALLLMNVLGARREAVVPISLVSRFEALLNEKKYQEAYEVAKSDESMLGQVLSAGLAKLSYGYNQAIEAMQETGEDENMKLEHRLSYVALIGVISPMIGLLGTVQGMIQSFQVIAISATTPPASKLAEGIATALFTTLVGLMIAIPAIAAHGILRNRIARLALETGILAEELMSRFSNLGGKKTE